MKFTKFNFIQVGIEMKYKIKRNDTVKVIAGKEKRKTGKVRSVLRDDNKVLLKA